MKCDNCGEDIKDAVTTTKNGEKWCYACTKKAKYPANPKRTKTKDKFVLLARKLRGLYSPGRGFDTVFLKYGEKRIYTNSHVLIGEMGETPSRYKLIDTDNLWELPKDRQFKYPLIEKLLGGDVETSDMVLIPEDFYEYAKAFGVKAARMKVRVRVKTEGITVSDHRDESSLFYGEFTVPLINEADYDYAYWMALRPREMVLRGDKPAYVYSSYNPALEDCVAVVMMPMGKE